MFLFKLNQKVKVRGFGNGHIIALPYNNESHTYIVEFEKTQQYCISKSNPVLCTYTTIVVDDKDLTPLE